MAGTALLVLEVVALFFIVSFGIALLQRRIGSERLKAWMGGRPTVAALKGIAVGFLTPFCTYSAIPMLVGLRKAGVPTAGFVAFIVAAPVLDPILFGALAIIVGADVAILYAVVAFTGAMSVALLAQRVGIDHLLEPVAGVLTPAAMGAAEPPQRSARAAATTRTADGPDSCASQCETGEAPWLGLSTEAPRAVGSSLRLLRSMGAPLLVGVALGLFIEAFVPVEAAVAITGGHSAVSIPLAAALGIPLYFHTGLFVPIADSLSNAGVGVGTIVALTIAGAGANVPEFVVLARLARPRLVAVLFAFVFLVALVGGLLAHVAAG